MNNLFFVLVFMVIKSWDKEYLIFIFHMDDGATKHFTITTLWANSADNELIIFFLFFFENRFDI